MVLLAGSTKQVWRAHVYYATKMVVGSVFIGLFDSGAKEENKPLQVLSLPSTLLTRFLEMVQTVFILIL